MAGPGASRARSAKTVASVPPALSPPTAIRVASMPSAAAWAAAYRVAAKASSTAAGNGDSGAFRYSTDSTAHRAALASVRQTTSWVSRSPMTQPPP